MIYTKNSLKLLRIGIHVVGTCTLVFPVSFCVMFFYKMGYSRENPNRGVEGMEFPGVPISVQLSNL